MNENKVVNKEKIELTNATHDLYTLLTTIFKNDTLKYTKSLQRLTFNSLSLSLSRCFTFFIPSFSYFLLFSNSHASKNITSLIFIRYFYILSFCYVMDYAVLEICIGGGFLEDCFYCYSKQITFDVVNESLISCNFIKGHHIFFSGYSTAIY